ncbi:QacE family quaternary ammonium compound efflux SMR transporter [Helicobacter monodelphidis]|uniref:DMT family transporter n=1 Tax=Helicobacter sp. 15-1451 TaxID=2004995 RepID=UPI000DCE813C|nr:multidrug efflux SMR transporter [Helicobacter sp. 15-1451]RAX58898.1 QacE family quaternary ammonium compound efflux SMR transporter [Helicobacter sp. 15-1451]
MNKNIAWLCVIFGGICEIFWVSGLKYADSILLYGLTALGIVFSFTCMVLACKVIEVGIAYAVFVGIGTAGVVIAEMLVFGEEVSMLKIVLIGIMLVSIIGLKLLGDRDENCMRVDSKESTKV